MPSVIQYGTRDSSRFQWGFEVTPEAQNPLRWFKLLLNEQRAGTSRQPDSRAERVAQTHTGDTSQLADLMDTIASFPPNKTPVGVVTDYLKGIYDHTLKTIASAYPGSFSKSLGNDIPIEICLTVPAVCIVQISPIGIAPNLRYALILEWQIWDDAAKDLTLQAVRAAGIESHIKIKTVSEPEAAAVHCLKTFQATENSLQVHSPIDSL